MMDRSTPSRSRSRSRSPLRWRHRDREERSWSREKQTSGYRGPWRPRETPHREVHEHTRAGTPAHLEKSGRIVSYPNILVKADIVPEFDPEKSELPATLWLNKIEQLGAIHGWNDDVKSYYMQSRLVGLAKMWHGALRDYEFSWAEWKAKITEAFPQNEDYAESLKEMLARKKQYHETMTQYFYSKSTLLTKCELVGEKAVACIIEGLPFHLRTSARAGNYRTSGELYSKFLCMNDDRKTFVSRSSTRYKINNVPKENEKAPENTQSIARKEKGVVNCFLCHEPGHIVRSCPKNGSVSKCGVCGKLGHKDEQCFKRQINHVTIQVNESYFKKISINGVELIAYLDTGAQVNLISSSSILKLGFDMQPFDVFISGFGGKPFRARGKITTKLMIDGLEVVTDFVVTDVSLNRADVFLGQPILNDEKYELSVCGTSVTLKPSVKETQEVIDINTINTVQRPEKINLLCTKETIVPPRTGLLVQVRSNTELDKETLLFVDTSCCSYGSIEYSISSFVQNYPIQTIIVNNYGSQPVKFAEGQVVARAMVTDEVLVENRPLLANHESSMVLGIDASKVNCGSNDRAVLDELLQILQEYSDCFAAKTSQLGLTDKIELNIDLTCDKPICYRPYRLSLSEKVVVREKIDDLLSNGIIRESTSNYSSPIVLVRKKNGEYRLCVDFRKLNNITVKDKYPLPIIEEQIEKLGNKHVFTSLDMTQSFYQIPVAKESIHKTGFVTPEGHFEFLRMPFGLANSPAVFQRLMDNIFDSLRFDTVIPYIDDVLLPTKTEREGLSLLRVVLGIIKDAGLTLNLDKCAFLQSKIDYLGYEISEAGIRPGSAKINAVAKFKEPENVHELRMFLGLTSYFRKFVQGYATISYELYKLLKKDVAWGWGPLQKEAFNRLIHILTTRPVLAIFQVGADVEVHTDASSKGLGGILLQRQDGELKPVAYFSRKTSKEESMYHSYELETLAVVESLRRFRIYIAGTHFKVVTDCSAVRYTFLKKDLLPRIARWWLSIQEYDMDVEHRPGKSHSHVDALSRCPVESPQTVDINAIDVFDWVICLQNQDEKLRIIRAKLEGGDSDPEINNNYRLVDDRLYRIIKQDETRLVVPKYGRWNILRKYHDLIGHPGLQRCEKIIKESFWFPGMTRFIRKYVNSCLDCLYKRGQYGRQEGRLHPIEKVAEPLHTLHIDHLGPFCKSQSGNSYLLLVVDGFTKFVWATPCRTTKTKEVIKALRDIFCLFGYPTRIISDSGTSFKSKNFKQFCLDNQIKHIVNAVACPRANGQVERYNRTLLDAVNTSVEDEREWDTKLQDITWGMNNLENASTGFSPYKLMFSASRSRYQGLGINRYDNEEDASRCRTEASAKIDKSAEKMRKYFDARRKLPTKYKVNDLVLWKGAADRNINVRRKLKEKYSGPYKVTRVAGNDRYIITSLKGVKGYKKFKALVSSDSLKPFHADNDDDISSNDSQVDSTEELIDLLEG